MQALAPARQPALDGVRGLAILLVLVHHWTTPPAALAFGWTGVDLFFVLSGFLLGGRLLDTPLGTPGYFRGFYGRRAFRILPLYALTLVCFAAMRGLPAALAGENNPLWPYLVFAQNLVTTGPKGAWMGITWSLAVEEHFYLLLPLLLFLPRRTVPFTCGGLALFSFAWRVAVGVVSGAEAAFFSTPCRIEGPLVGVLLAWWFRRGTLPSPRVCGWIAAIAAGGLSAFAAATGGGWAMRGNAWSITLAELGAVAAIAAANRGGAPRLWRFPALRWLGIRAFPLYLFHHGIFVAMQLYGPFSHPAATFVATAVVTLLLAEALGRLVEQPAIDLGKRLLQPPLKRAMARSMPSASQDSQASAPRTTIASTFAPASGENGPST